MSMRARRLRPTGANAVADINRTAASSTATRRKVNDAKSFQEHLGVRHEELRNLEQRAMACIWINDQLGVWDVLG